MMLKIGIVVLENIWRGGIFDHSVDVDDGFVCVYSIVVSPQNVAHCSLYT